MPRINLEKRPTKILRVGKWRYSISVAIVGILLTYTYFKREATVYTKTSLYNTIHNHGRSGSGPMRTRKLLHNMTNSLTMNKCCQPHHMKEGKLN